GDRLARVPGVAGREARSRAMKKAVRAKPGGLARTAFRAPRSAATEHQGALDLLDRLGHLDAARAGIGAVEGGAAPPDTVNVVEDVQPLLGGLVPAVEDEPVRVDDRRRTEVGAVGPVHRARRGARRAQD